MKLISGYKVPEHPAFIRTGGRRMLPLVLLPLRNGSDKARVRRLARHMGASSAAWPAVTLPSWQLRWQLEPAPPTGSPPARASRPSRPTITFDPTPIGMTNHIARQRLQGNARRSSASAGGRNNRQGRPTRSPRRSAKGTVLRQLARISGKGNIYHGASRSFLRGEVNFFHTS